jgi:translocation and assembly module TamA
MAGALAMFAVFFVLALLAGCAALPSPTVSNSAAEVAAIAPTTAASSAASAAASGVQVEVLAPTDLKALLERHLDLIRLGAMPRDDVDETEWKRLIEAAPAQARELLQTQGHFSARVTVERESARTPGTPDRVRLLVEPGPQAIVSQMNLQLEGDLDRAASSGDAYAQQVARQLQGNWPLSAGRGFSNPVWSDAKAAALARLRAAGYANAVWTGTAAEVDRERNEVRLFVSAESGPLFKLGFLDIEGLSSQDAETVRNLAVAARGTPITETWLLDFQDRLQKSGLYSSINVTLDTESEPADQAHVLVRLREAPLQVYTFGLGYSANTGARASVEHVWRRAFGYAATARNKIEWGEKRQFWTGEISSQPGEGLYRNLVGGTVERLKTDTDTVLSQRLRLGRTQDGVRLERLAFVEAERSVRTTDQSSLATVATSVNYHAVWRDVDNVILPTRGYTFSGQVGLGASHGGGSNSGFFGRAYGRLTGYWPLGRSWYGQARLEAGQVFRRADVAAPESQLFRAGGDDSVRGYAYRSLGPVVDGAVGGGNALVTTSLELARPVSAALPSVWGALFVDAGQATDRFGDMRPFLGYGLGVRWRSPVGPLRLDWAYGQELQRWRLHFSVGIAF